LKDPFVYFFAAYVFVSIAAFIKWREYSQEKKLRELVSWSALGDYSPALGRYSYLSELLYAVLNAQYDDAIDKKYRITEEFEKQYVREIIEEYQKDIMRSYFKGHLKLIKSKYVVNGEDYFLITMRDFLESHQCDEKFLCHDMHEEIVEYKRYGDWGGPCYDATYALTDFAIVFNKLYYITYLYCKHSKIANPRGNRFSNEMFIKEILDTKQIQISRF